MNIPDRALRVKYIDTVGGTECRVHVSDKYVQLLENNQFVGNKDDLASAQMGSSVRPGEAAWLNGEWHLLGEDLSFSVVDGPELGSAITASFMKLCEYFDGAEVVCTRDSTYLWKANKKKRIGCTRGYHILKKLGTLTMVRKTDATEWSSFRKPEKILNIGMVCNYSGIIQSLERSVLHD